MTKRRDEKNNSEASRDERLHIREEKKLIKKNGEQEGAKKVFRQLRRESDLHSTTSSSHNETDQANNNNNNDNDNNNDYDIPTSTHNSDQHPVVASPRQTNVNASPVQPQPAVIPKQPVPAIVVTPPAEQMAAAKTILKAIATKADKAELAELNKTREDANALVVPKKNRLHKTVKTASSVAKAGKAFKNYFGNRKIKLGVSAGLGSALTALGVMFSTAPFSVPATGLMLGASATATFLGLEGTDKAVQFGKQGIELLNQYNATRNNANVNDNANVDANDNRNTI